MGVSDSIGSRLISLDELKKCCIAATYPTGFICAGIDWSGGGTKGNSRTVVTIMCRHPGGKFSLLDYKIYEDLNPVDTINNVDRYTADRTTLIDCFFHTIKKGGMEFPVYDKMKECFNDYLAEYEEVTASGKKVWRHSPNSPDDCLHSSVFCWIACKILTNDLTFY
jgi:hypothetical protein